MTKPNIKESFTLDGVTYNLEHYPNNPNRRIPLNFGAMKIANPKSDVRCEKVVVPLPNGSVVEKWMVLIFAQQSVPINSTNPPAKFLMYKLVPTWVDPAYEALDSMVIYGYELSDDAKTMPQRLINVFFGSMMAPADKEKDEKWVTEIFSLPDAPTVEQEQPAAEGFVNAN